MPVQHIVQAENDPFDPPPSIGAHYINTATGTSFIAVGTSYASDWIPQIGYQRASIDPSTPPAGPGIYINDLYSAKIWIAAYIGGESWSWVQLATMADLPA